MFEYGSIIEQAIHLAVDQLCISLATVLGDGHSDANLSQNAIASIATTAYR